ncbi:hypothetical protein J5X98_21705 [Leptothermofonsia sichuanensis E412]|uniref:hypothetical protein n=1 Tax=Leptothermofonsia sichuanensis TaxID=2917832 RepID=UPI001CA75C19|nr:hypothetical protein [Leptothermofonsia sichuanensis]QZZ19892.1 hypothetical protein J5X98_21705 [Leptothermofonsia sichuanensis E412]
MNVNSLPLLLALTTLLPMAAQAQPIPSPGNLSPNLDVPKNVNIRTTISGTITAKNPDQILKAYGPVKCNQFKVTLRQSDPNYVTVRVPGQPARSRFPDSYAPVTVQATGNHIGLGCKFSLAVPANAGEKAYLVAEVPLEWLRVSPSGWQNPMPLPIAGFKHDGGRNFVANLVEIK